MNPLTLSTASIRPAFSKVRTMCRRESVLHLRNMAKRVPRGSEKAFFPLHASLDELREASKTSKACDLWKLGTQTVFGEGMPTAKIMLVGEQPGNQEDLEGKPFVGPEATREEEMKQFIADLKKVTQVR